MTNEFGGDEEQFEAPTFEEMIKKLEDIDTNQHKAKFYYTSNFIRSHQA